MKFTEETVFPVFTKSPNAYCCFLSIHYSFLITLKGSVISYGFQEALDSDQTPITQKEFIELNKKCLEKTGLINLFEGSEREIGKYSEPVKILKEQKEEIECLKIENKHLRKGLNISNNDLEQSLKNVKETYQKLRSVEKQNIQLEEESERNSIRQRKHLARKNESISELASQIKSLEATLKFYL